MVSVEEVQLEVFGEEGNKQLKDLQQKNLNIEEIGRGEDPGCRIEEKLLKTSCWQCKQTIKFIALNHWLSSIPLEVENGTCTRFALHTKQLVSTVIGLDNRLFLGSQHPQKAYGWCCSVLLMWLEL